MCPSTHLGPLPPRQAVLSFFPILHWLPLRTSVPLEAASVGLMLGRLDRVHTALMDPAVLPGTQVLCAAVCNVLRLLTGIPASTTCGAGGQGCDPREALQQQPALCRLVTPRWLVAFTMVYGGFALPSYLVHAVWESYVAAACRLPQRQLHGAGTVATGTSGEQAGARRRGARRGGGGGMVELVLMMVCVHVPMLLVLALVLCLLMFAISSWD